MRPVSLCATLAIAATTLAGCATTSAVTGPEAFPRARPVPNGPAEPEGTTAGESSPLAARVAPAPLPASAAVLGTALSLMGTKYRFGGTTPDTGFDCSGFVSYVLRQHSIDLPRTVAEQFGAGRPVPQDEIQAGDLVFFTTTGPGATHVGLVVTTGDRWEFVHAPTDGASVRIERFDTGYWQQRWIGARRVF